MSLPPRLRLWPTTNELTRMARHPAAYAPTAAEVLTPGPVPKLVIAMGPDERRLMDAIIADPHADAPRLRYADWVEATDAERAAFIRGQLEWRNLPPPGPPLPGRKGGAWWSAPPSLLGRGVGGVGSEQEGGWGVGFLSRLSTPFLPFGARDVVFRRGFAEAMSLTGRAFISLGAALFDATPLREVRLIAVNFLLPELLACPNLARLKVLDLRGNRVDPAALVGCEWLRGVQVLC